MSLKRTYNIVMLVTKINFKTKVAGKIEEGHRHTYPVHLCLSSVRFAQIIHLSVYQQPRPLTKPVHLSVLTVQRSLQTPSWRDLCHVITPWHKQAGCIEADLSVPLLCNLSRTKFPLHSNDSQAASMQQHIRVIFIDYPNGSNFSGQHGSPCICFENSKTYYINYVYEMKSQRMNYTTRNQVLNISSQFTTTAQPRDSLFRWWANEKFELLAPLTVWRLSRNLQMTRLHQNDPNID